MQKMQSIEYVISSVIIIFSNVLTKIKSVWVLIVLMLANTKDKGKSVVFSYIIERPTT